MTADRTAAVSGGPCAGGVAPPSSTRKRPQFHNPQVEAKVKGLHEAGRPRTEIASEIGCSVWTVDRLIRGWSSTQRPSLPPDAVDRYNRGESEASIAKDAGCQPETALRLLTEAGARVPKDAKQRRHADIIHRYTKRNESLRTIAAQVERSYGYVHSVLVNAKVELRPRGGHHPRSTGHANNPTGVQA